MSMLAITSLLNPDPPGADSVALARFRPSPALTSPTTPLIEEYQQRQQHPHTQNQSPSSAWLQQQQHTPPLQFQDSRSFALSSSSVPRQNQNQHRHRHQQARMAVVASGAATRESGSHPKIKPKGDINFRPFEDVDEESRRQIQKFNVHALGNIRDSCQHIPYNSGKKDFSEKTGRESLEVFCYNFKIEGNDTEYTVRWDYNVGLVRMTDFFKALNYPKTAPAKMLNQNEGLKAITPSITGGSIKAQGYWMPYKCAKAICATFCHRIAGALIPLFGSSFPSICIPPESPEYGRWVIDPAIIAESRVEAERYKRMYIALASAPVPSPSSPNSSTASSPRRMLGRREEGHDRVYYSGGATSHPDGGMRGGAGYLGRRRPSVRPILTRLDDRYCGPRGALTSSSGYCDDRYRLDDRISGQGFGQDLLDRRLGSPYGTDTDGEHEHPASSSYGRGHGYRHHLGGTWPATAPSTPTYGDQSCSGWTPATVRYPRFGGDLDRRHLPDGGGGLNHSHSRSQPTNELGTGANPMLSAIPRCPPTSPWEPGPGHNTTRERSNTGPNHYPSRPPFDAVRAATEPRLPHHHHQPPTIPRSSDIVYASGPTRSLTSPDLSWSSRKHMTANANAVDQNSHLNPESPRGAEDIRTTAVRAVAMCTAKEQKKEQQQKHWSQEHSPSGTQPRNGGADSNAALLLLHLSVHDRNTKGGTGKTCIHRDGRCIAEIGDESDDDDGDGGEDNICDPGAVESRKRKEGAESTKRRSKRRKGSVSSD